MTPRTHYLGVLTLLLFLTSTLSLASTTSSSSTLLSPSSPENETTSLESSTDAESTSKTAIKTAQSDVQDLENRIQLVQDAPLDPVLQSALDAETAANKTVTEDIEEKEMWKTVVDNLISNSEAWGNASKAEAGMKHNASMAALDDGEALTADREKLNAMRQAIDTGKENVQVSQLADSILESSNQLREGMDQMNTYKTESDTAKQEFSTSLKALKVLKGQLNRASPTEKVDLEQKFTTKQGYAIAQKEKILSLNETMMEQKDLIQTLHTHINTIVVSKKADNATTPSLHTQKMISKLNIMEHLVETMASNVSEESKDLLAENENLDAINGEKSQINNQTESVNSKMEKAARFYANASQVLKKDIKTEALLRTTYEEAQAVDDNTRHNAVLKLNNSLAEKNIELMLAEDELDGEKKGEKAALDAAKAEDSASDAIKKAEEVSFENKEKEMLTEHPVVVDNEILPWENEKNDNTNQASQKIREIVSNLLWSEGHSASAKAASQSIVNAVHAYTNMPNSVKTQDAKTSNAKTTSEKNTEKIQDTKHLDAKIAGIKETERAAKEKEAVEAVEAETAKAAKAAASPRFRFATASVTSTTSTTSTTTTSTTPPTSAKAEAIKYGKVISTDVARVGSAVVAAASSSSRSVDASRLDPVPDTCFDGIQNGQETGIDCGGDCHRKCGMLTVRSKHDGSGYHTISYVPRANDETSDLQKKHEQEEPHIVKQLPASVLEHAKKHSEEQKAQALQTDFTSSEDGSDRLVEGKWEEVAANLLETNQRRLRRVPKKMVAGGV